MLNKQKSPKHRGFLAMVAGCALAACALGLGPGRAWGQAGTIPRQDVFVNINSGPRDARPAAREPEIVYANVVGVQDAPWVRLHFGNVALGRGIDGSTSYLKITSLQDGAMQTLDPHALEVWRNTTAHFTGAWLLVQLFAAPGSVGNEVNINMIEAGVAGGAGGGGEGGIASICGPTDDRVPSTDVRVGRIIGSSGGGNFVCTGFIVGNNCLLTAGHCTEDANGQFDPNAMQVVHFNVPASDAGGNIVPSHPDDQYPVDPTSVQAANTNIGNDWCYFGVFDNTNTGLSPFLAQGAQFSVAGSMPAFDNGSLTITGHGADTQPTRNHVQQTHSGTYDAMTVVAIVYDDIDTEGGLSGGPVIKDSANQVIGIHTNGGCDDPFILANFGTRIDNFGLRAAMAIPQGICASGALSCPYDPGCCTLVCNADAFCCNDWDASCVALAHQLCFGPGDPYEPQPNWQVRFADAQVYTEAQATHPVTCAFGSCMLGPFGLSLFDPFNMVAASNCEVGFLIGTQPSHAQGYSRVRITGQGTKLIEIVWHNDTNTAIKDPCAAFFNFGIADFFTEIGLGVIHQQAGNTDVHYLWRHTSLNWTEHEGPDEDPASIESSFLLLNLMDLPGAPGSGYNLGGIGSVTVPNTTGVLQLAHGDGFLFHAGAESESNIRFPVNAINGEDQSSNTFYGRLYLSLDGPVMLSGPFTCPSPQDCCMPSQLQLPGCNNAPCCSAVCLVDPFCCDLEWDALCVHRARQESVCNCSVGGPNPPAHDLCASAATVQPGLNQFDNTGAQTDGPPSPCGFTGVPNQDHDIWYRFHPTCSGPTFIGITPLNLDALVAVYEGGCPQAGFAEVACTPAPAGQDTGITFIASANFEYIIRIGGQNGQQGQGEFSLTWQCNCPADVTGNGVVDVDDLLAVINNWGGGGPADITGDGIVNVDDLLAVINNWGPCP